METAPVKTRTLTFVGGPYDGIKESVTNYNPDPEDADTLMMSYFFVLPEDRNGDGGFTYEGFLVYEVDGDTATYSHLTLPDGWEPGLLQDAIERISEVAPELGLVE